MFCAAERDTVEPLTVGVTAGAATPDTTAGIGEAGRTAGAAGAGAGEGIMAAGETEDVVVKGADGITDAGAMSEAPEALTDGKTVADGRLMDAI